MTSATSAEVEIKVLRNVRKLKAKPGAVVKVTADVAASMIERGVALAYDDKQRAADKAAEEHAAALKAAEATLKAAQATTAAKKEEAAAANARAQERVGPSEITRGTKRP